MNSSAENHSHTRRKSGAGPRGRGDPVRRGARAQVALGWAALVVLLGFNLANGAYEPVAWTMLCLATLLLFAVQAVLDIRYGLPVAARRALWLLLPYGAVLVWLLLQGMPGFLPEYAHPFWAFAPDGAIPAISAQPDGGGQTVMRLTCYSMMFWIFLKSARAARKGGLGYIQALALFSTALAIYGMVSLEIGANVLLGTEHPDPYLRASFFNRDTYATLAVFGVLASIVSFFHTILGASGSGRAMRNFLEAFFAGGWVYAFATLVGLAAVAMTLSRGGSLAGLLGFTVLVWGLRRRLEKVPPLLYAIPVALVGFAVLFMSAGTVERFGDIDIEGDPRSAIYEQVLAGISDRPWLGHGAGAFREAFWPYSPPEFSRFTWGKAHSTYLENAFEYGLPAAALFYVPLAVIGWRLLRGVLTRRRNQLVPAFGFACFMAGAAHASVDFTLQYPALAALFAAILGIGWGQSFPRPRRAGDAEPV